MSRNTFDTLKKQLLTEKSLISRDKQNKYAFIVNNKANKHDVKEAIESIFKVTVLKVSTMNVIGKEAKVGKYVGKKTDWKKAIVTLKEGDKIDAAQTAAK
ncbi:MAG: 50S ribosomal protein L23 [Elusimicrobiaceae bacterium]|jgi:large subunit ribosomal protein L23|nr:50S ribosomal protein L23 [Elusimicrobiaceae bacterium]MBT3955103.1 50S ribosomal protein L23 [Elusimicrobiaceae bacterium]MBT4007720.1 50S ribosomal protein L23 [Elusimicrobiaceae bacterium]MBT4403409.1 50S ribosomal protein L23 [Elusimicrobiaceae bacterium]MBT4440444.1 50S ribosomal protein L23 [Elusimicrobiaceae bacterium]